MPKIAPTSPLYAQFRQDFPAQAGEGITGDLNYSDTIVPIVDMTSAAGTGTLQTNLQTAYDFSTGSFSREDSSEQIITNAGFWQIDVAVTGVSNTNNRYGRLYLSDGISTPVNFYYFELAQSSTNQSTASDRDSLVVFVNSGQSVYAQSSSQDIRISGVYRQIATLNGVPTNPLGFTFN